MTKVNGEANSTQGTRAYVLIRNDGDRECRLVPIDLTINEEGFDSLPPVDSTCGDTAMKVVGVIHTDDVHRSDTGNKAVPDEDKQGRRRKGLIWFARMVFFIVVGGEKL